MHHRRAEVFHASCIWRNINVIELKSVRLAILSFTKLKILNSIHLRIDNITGLSYLLSMGDTQNKHLFKILEHLFDSTIYTLSEHSYSRLEILKLQ